MCWRKLEPPPGETKNLQLITDHSWRNPFRFLIAAQFMSALGFGFASPFLPLYIAEIGNFSARDAALWAGIVGGINGLALVLAGPVWGIMGDWFGYKRNVLRAAFGTSLAFLLLGLVRNIPQLVGARFFMGVVGGILPAGLGLATTLAPRARMGFVVGALYGVVYFGNTIGPLIGGYFVDWTSLRAGFLVSAGIILVSSLIFLFGTKESQKDSTATRHDLKGLWGEIRTLSGVPGVRKVLVLLFLIQFAVNLTPPTVPLLLASLDPLAKNTIVGIFFALSGAAITVSTYGSGILASHFTSQRVFFLGALLALIGSFLMFTVGSVAFALGFGVILGLGSGTLLTSTSAAVGEVSPANRQGFAFGMVQSASSLGFAVGPLVGGIIANTAGLHAPFLAQGIVFVVLVVVAAMALRGPRRRPAQA